MCILITAISPRGCCRKELVIQCHLDQFSEFLYAKAGRVLADKCPKIVHADAQWNCYGNDCEYMYHDHDGRRKEASFNRNDDYDFLKTVELKRRHYNRLAVEMKKEFTKHGADDTTVAKAIQNLNNLPEDATLEEKAKEFSTMGFKITGMKDRKDKN